MPSVIGAAPALDAAPNRASPGVVVSKARLEKEALGALAWLLSRGGVLYALARGSSVTTHALRRCTIATLYLVADRVGVVGPFFSRQAVQVVTVNNMLQSRQSFRRPILQRAHVRFIGRTESSRHAAVSPVTNACALGYDIIPSLRPQLGNEGRTFTMVNSVPWYTKCSGAPLGLKKVNGG